MKRFLRYFIYRELYRWIRQAGQRGDSDSSKPLPDKPADMPRQRREDIPIEDGPIETVGELKAILQQMDPYDFEYFIADLWERIGWETEVPSASMDQGVDIIATKDHPYRQTTLLQAKRYGPNTTVGSPDIQQYASLIHQYDRVDKVIVVTTNRFTSQARDLANRFNVKLINGDELAELVAQYESLDLVAAYLDFVTAVEKEVQEEPQPDREDRREPADEFREPSEPEAPSNPATPSGAIPSTVWEKVIIAAIPGWLLAFFGVTFLPETVWGLLFFAVWFGLPIAIFLDARELGDVVEWPQYTWAYIITSLIWLLAIIPAGVYVWRRRSLEAARPREVSADDVVEKIEEPDETLAPDDEEAEIDDLDVPDPREEEEGETDEGTSVEPGEQGSGPEERMEIEYEGRRYYARTVTSSNDRYTVAFQDGRRVEGDPVPGRVFCYEGNELRFTREIDRPNACAISNDGTVAIIDWTLDWGDELSGTFHVYNKDGHRLLREEFDANLGPVAITPDGEYAATSTFNPDCTTYVFDVSSGQTILEHENQRGNVQALEFVDRDSDWMLRLGQPGGDSSYGIDLGGHVVWKSEGLRESERFESLLEQSQEADPTEALDLLNEAAILATEEYEYRNVTQRLADAHWNRANKIEEKEGKSPDWWMHLDESYENYKEILPRYDGKQGIAKVKRIQGKEHLNLDRPKEALECFEAIEELEQEYDVSLLTDADERRLAELRDDQTQ